jgi:D-threo-aldose 1-dehydrogenase
MMSDRVAVGRNGLKVPRLAFGTAPLATAPAWGPGRPISLRQSVDALIHAFQRGIRWFDSAPNYVCGLAESRLGRAVSQLPRSEIILSTKVGFDIQGKASQRDYSRDGVLRSLEGSLKRLRTDHVDIVCIHDPDETVRQVLDETFPALSDLRDAGVIGAIGAGMNQWQVPLEFARHADFDCFMVAGRWTLLEQGALPLLDYCYEHGIAIFAASIYNSGILAVGSASPLARYNHAPPSALVLDRVRALESICERFGVSLQTAATQFPFAHPAVTTLVVGFQSTSEVDICLEALRQDVPAAFWKALRDEGFLVSEAPLPSDKVVS